MATKRPWERRCSYVVLVRATTELRDLARYLSGLGSQSSVAECEVVILDPSPHLQFDLNARILRWVGRHVALSTTDVIRAATRYASCEKVIVAADDVRYAAEAIGQICSLLDVHEVVEPQDYLDPLPWWGGIDAGRILMHRGIETQPDHGATFGFRRSALRALRTIAPATAADARHLSAVGAEVYPAPGVFVRREPGNLGEWLTSRPRLAGDDFDMPMKTAFFFSLLPLLAFLAIVGGLQLAGGYASAIAFTSIVLAVRGRAGASSFFPLRACLFAPLSVLERSVSVYWALLRKLRGAGEDATRVHVPDRASGTKVAGVNGV